MQKSNRFIFVFSLSVTLLIVAFLVVPVVMSIMVGLSVNYNQGISSGLTTKWVVEVWNMYHSTIFLSLKIAIATTLINLIVGVPFAYYLVRHDSRWVRILDSLITLPIAIPGIALALALLTVYSGAGTFRASWAFILVGHVIFTLPFMVKSVSAIMMRISLPTLEEASKSLGASFMQGFFRVIVPNAKAGILSGVLMTLTLSIGEFNLTWMLQTPLTKTLPVGLADAYASMRLEIGSAYTLIFLIMMLPLMLFAQYVSNYQQRPQDDR